MKTASDNIRWNRLRDQLRRQISQAVVVITATTSAWAETPRIDGLFADWPETSPIATDPRGDATGAFDVTRIQAMTRGTALYLRFDTGRTLNLQDGLEAEGTVVVEVGLSAGDLQIDLRGRNATVNGKRVPLSTLPYVSAPTHAADEFELMIDLARFGVRLGDDVTMQFVGSRTPVTMLEKSGFRQRLLPHLIGESVVTWRNEGSDFPPGRLDVVTYTPGSLIARHGFVLDTAELSEAEQRRLGGKAGDS